MKLGTIAIWSVVVLVAVGVGIWLMMSHSSNKGNGHDEPVASSRPTTSLPAQPRKVPGVDVPFAVSRPYVDAKTHRIINPNDCDGDALPDDWEMARYGTLKYDDKTIRTAPAITKPVVKQDPKDTDGDGLPDDWERSHFGNLSQTAPDDFDEDGFDNRTEMLLGYDPRKPNLVDMHRKPARLASSRGGAGMATPALTDTVEFWQKQDRLRVKLGQQPATAPTR